MAKISKKRFNELADIYGIPVGDEKALDAISGVVVKDFINALNDEVNKFKNKWITWTGGKCPVDDETLVHVKLYNGRVYKNELAGSLFWQHEIDMDNIAKYKVAKN